MKQPMCSRCGERPAVIFYQKMVNGEMKPESLCFKCAKELNVDLGPIKTMIEKMVQQKYSNALPVKLVNYGKKNSFSEYFSSLAEYNSKSNINLNNFVPTSMILSRKPLYLWE